MRSNRFVSLNRPMRSLEAHLGVPASPQAPFPTDFVTLPVSASHRRFGSLPLAAEKGHAPVPQYQLHRVLHSKHAQATSPPCGRATLAGRTVGFVDAPRATGWRSKAVPAFDELGRITSHPAQDRRGSQRQSPFGHHLDQIAQAELVAQIPANAQNDDLSIKMWPHEKLLHTLQPAHLWSSVRFAPTALTDSPTLFATEPFPRHDGICAWLLKVTRSTQQLLLGHSVQKIPARVRSMFQHPSVRYATRFMFE